MSTSTLSGILLHQEWEKTFTLFKELTVLKPDSPKNLFDYLLGCYVKTVALQYDVSSSSNPEKLDNVRHVFHRMSLKQFIIHLDNYEKLSPGMPNHESFMKHLEVRFFRGNEGNPLFFLQEIYSVFLKTYIEKGISLTSVSRQIGKSRSWACMTMRNYGVEGIR